MITRYAILTGLIVAVALVTGVIVHLVAGSTKYVASCEFQLALPSTSTAPSSDILVFNRRQAADELARAQLERVWSAVGRETGVSPNAVAADQTVVQASDSSFRVSATTTAPSRAVSMANGLCRQYVSQVSSQVHNEQINEIDGLRSQISSLERQLRPLTARKGQSLSVTQRVERLAIVNAISRSRDILTVSLSLPPDNISVLSPATTAAPHSTKPSLSKALIVAAAAGLLASFLLILGLEAVRGRQVEAGRPDQETVQPAEG
jgi:capsular polysaccharide biosynthesis protein